MPMDCPHHSPHLTNLSHVTPKSSTRTIIPEVPPVPNHPYRINVPPELRDSVHRTIGYALNFLLDMLDYSPEEPNNEADLRLVTTPANSRLSDSGGGQHENKGLDGGREMRSQEVRLSY